MVISLEIKPMRMEAEACSRTQARSTDGRTKAEEREGEENYNQMNRNAHIVRLVCRVLDPHMDHRQCKDQARNEQDPCRDKDIHEPA